MANMYGPTLPNKNNSERTVTIGPTLPPHLLKLNSKEEAESGNPQNDKSETDLSQKPNTPPQEQNYGPALPPNFRKSKQDDSGSDEEYGPLPAGVSTTSLAQQALAERALQIKLDMLNGVHQAKPEEREQWMLELPAVGGAHLGLGPRQFRKNERPDFSDRTSWTDTPQLKEQKASGKVADIIDLKKEAELREIVKRNKEKDKVVAEYNKKQKRDKSLVDMHQEKLKKKKMDDAEATTSRKPFNRETDLKINQFDDAQKKAIMRKAMHLDDRFSRGQSKYL